MKLKEEEKKEVKKQKNKILEEGEKQGEEGIDIDDFDDIDDAEAEEKEKEMEEKEAENDHDKDNEEEVKINVEKMKKINKKFKRNECEYSLFILSQTNSIRFFCISFVHSKKFDNFILYLIALSTLRLILDTFFDSTPTTNVIFDSCDIVFNFFFYIEFGLKVVGEGFVWENGTYLSDNWNKLDFIIVVVSMFDMQTIYNNFTGQSSKGGISFFRVLRLLRTLRPLRFISHNVQLKLIVKSLMDSVEPILNVLAIVFIVFLMFGIAGIILFSENYHTCYQNSLLYGYPLAFESFGDMYSAVNITSTDEASIDAYVYMFNNI